MRKEPVKNSVIVTRMLSGFACLLSLIVLCQGQWPDPPRLTGHLEQLDTQAAGGAAVCLEWHLQNDSTRSLNFDTGAAMQVQVNGQPQYEPVDEATLRAHSYFVQSFWVDAPIDPEHPVTVTVTADAVEGLSCVVSCELHHRTDSQGQPYIEVREVSQ